MWRLLPLLGLVAGCGVKIAGDTSNNPRVDADPGVDAPIPGDGSDITNPIDAAPAVRRVVYLNFDGVTLTQGASDATKNQAAWLQAASGTAPKYHAGSGTRAADIATIFNGVTSRLDNVAIVTQTRPATGPYVMIVYGGAASDVASFYGVAVSQLDCGDKQPNDVAWIADEVAPAAAVNTTLGAIGFGLGLTAVDDPTDCMCSWADQCSPSGGACVLHTNATRDPNTLPGPGNEVQSCAGAPATQDELAAFQTAFQ